MGALFSFAARYNNNMNINITLLSDARRLGIEEARKGISNTATVSSILKGIGAKLDVMDLSPEQTKLLVSYYDKGVSIAKGTN